MSNATNLTSDVVGINGAQVTTFYIPWNYGTYPYYIQDGDSTWSDGSTASTGSFSNITTDTRTEFTVASVTTPNGDTLDNYTIHDVCAYVYVASDWHYFQFVEQANGGTAMGVRSMVFSDHTKIVTQTAISYIYGYNNYHGGQSYNSGAALSNTPRPCKIKIVCSK